MIKFSDSRFHWLLAEYVIYLLTNSGYLFSSLHKQLTQKYISQVHIKKTKNQSCTFGVVGQIEYKVSAYDTWDIKI